MLVIFIIWRLLLIVTLNGLATGVQVSNKTDNNLKLELRELRLGSEKKHYI